MPLQVRLHNYLPPALHEDRNKNYFSCLHITRERTKWLWSSQIPTLLVFKLYLSGQAACPSGCEPRNWTPESEKPAPASSRPLKLAIARHSTKAFRERIGFLAKVSQTNWDIYQHKYKTTKIVVCLYFFQPGMFTLAGKVFITLVDYVFVLSRCLNKIRMTSLTSAIDYNIRLFPTLIFDQSTPEVSVWTSLSRPVSDWDSFIYI